MHFTTTGVTFPLELKPKHGARQTVLSIPSESVCNRSARTDTIPEIKAQFQKGLKLTIKTLLGDCTGRLEP